MSLVVCSDLSPAAWIVMSTEPWQRLVTIGPAGFAAYARVRFIPDPTHQGQQEHEADLDASPGETAQWRALLHLLAAETADPDDCYFGLWDGWVFPESARAWPTFAVPRDAELPARSYYLFMGRSRKPRSGARPGRQGSGVVPSSRGAARPRSSGRRTARGASRRI